MSVAFRREGDDEHLEPKFEIPIPPGPNLVTPRGLTLIAARVAQLEAALIEAAADEVRVKALKRDLRYWQTRQITAEIVPAPDEEIVAIGSEVTFLLGESQRIITITGYDEADPTTGHVSFAAPLARAMLGLAAGNFADFGGKDDALEILSTTAGKASGFEPA